LKREFCIAADADLIVASVGGGKFGIVLMQPLLEGFKRLGPDPPVTLRAFTGPYMPEEEFRRLSRYSGPRVTVKRFTARFLTYLSAARLSVSMGGYNTCMNILATGVPALVWPYPGDREQGLRAECLAAIGALEVLKDGDLQPERLARRMDAARSRRSPSTGSIDLDGAPRTARWLVHHRMPPARGEG
jgi:predicted glycosyltransferase